MKGIGHLGNLPLVTRQQIRRVGFTLRSLTPGPPFNHKAMLHKDGPIILAVGPDFPSLGWGKSVDLKEGMKRVHVLS